MKRFLATVLAVIAGALVLLLLVVAGLALSQLPESVPGRVILEADFEQSLIEYVPDDPLAQAILSDRPRVRDVVEALERAAADDRVLALVARVGAADRGLGQTQELRDAVERFRQSGKPAIAWAETFGEFGPGSGAYYLATAFDEIWLQPSGDVCLTGIVAESPFVRGTLDKLGIVPRMDHRYEYKNAKNLFTERRFTAAHEEATRAILDSHFGQLVRGIAERRGLTEDEVRALVDRGPFLAAEALEARLVDRLGYRDEVYAYVRERAADAELLYLDEYLERAGRPHEDGTTVALIYGVGPVHRGESGYDWFMEGGPSMGSDTVAAAFRAAIENEDVRAILFRVDSPGGSYVASDTIWREVVRARAAGKKVVVSMGDVAGSGGYFVAMAADKIVAHPGTITASIGVLGGKMLTEEAWRRIGVTWDEVHAGQNARIWTGTSDYSDAEWQRFQDSLDRVYEDFTSKVASGRNLPKERVLEIAKGRVWTGEQALENGLVDALGGFAEALRLVRAELDLPEGAPLCLRLLPEEKGFLDMLMGEEPANSEEAAREVLAAAVRAAAPVLQVAQELGLGAAPQPLALPQPLRLR